MYRKSSVGSGAGVCDGGNHASFIERWGCCELQLILSVWSQLQ